MKSFPHVSPELLAALEEAFPDRLPYDPSTSPATVAALIGEQRVLRFLRRVADEQAEMALNGV